MRLLKGTVRVISSDPPCKAGKYELDIDVTDFENWLFSIVVSLQKWLA